tara:strand:- start:145 stop:357 length:213 start_codon:yes stop_codon:yes gene_type:complete
MPKHRLPLDDWFDDVPHPHDTMPIATDEPAKKSTEESNAELSLHEKAYRIATSKYNPFSIGGSESIHDFD